MKETFTNWRFILGLVIAHVLIYFAFSQSKVFWYIITGAMLFLIAFVILQEETDDRLSVGRYLLYGLLSGVLIYIIFWIGNFLIDLFHIKYFSKQVTKLYRLFAPEHILHYIALILILIPGEEIFWRGFVQKHLLKNTTMWKSVIISSLLYASVQIYSGYFILIIAAFICGIFWGYLYATKRSLPLVIISHLVFDLLLLVLFPLR